MPTRDTLRAIDSLLCILCMAVVIGFEVYEFEELRSFQVFAWIGLIVFGLAIVGVDWIGDWLDERPRTDGN